MVYYDYEEHKCDNGVYMLFCKATHMVYVGSTNTMFKDRQQDHFSKLKNGKHTLQIQLDYNKYGKESFEFIIVSITNNIEEARTLEEKLIEYYKTIGLSYNIVSHAITTGTKATDKTKRKMSESHKGQKLTDYQRRKLLEANKYRKRTDAEKKKLSEHFAGSKSSLAILDEEKVAEIKKKLIAGKTKYELAEEYDVTPSCINNIRKDYRWKHVKVDGWEEFQASLPKWSRIPEEIRAAMAEDLLAGELPSRVGKKYNVSWDAVMNVKKEYNIQ